MKRIIGTILLLLPLLSFGGSPHSKHHVIIDTDGGIDDLRAICLSLASDEIEVLAITTSDGVLEPKVSLKKVRRVLYDLGHEGISSASGKKLNNSTFKYRKIPASVSWGSKRDFISDDGNEAVECMASILQKEKDPVTILALGPLTNVSDAIKKNSAIKKEIAEIIWYNNTNPALSAGFNYKADSVAAKHVLRQSIKLGILHKKPHDTNNYMSMYLESLGKLRYLTPYTEKILVSHQKLINKHPDMEKHLLFRDDLVPVYLLHPSLFTKVTYSENGAQGIYPKDNKLVIQKMVNILSDKNSSESIVFDHFPLDPEFYKDDVQQYINGIIRKHGKTEWRIGVLTNEIHDHLGIYSIVGAKMGLRARDFFNAGKDEFQVTSYAGQTPPVSCLNDGLQVSTGATLGHGLITIANEKPVRPEALFTLEEHRIKISLKERYQKILKKDIRQGIEKHGKLTEGYWNYVRKLALRYWLEWDRREIFTITELK